MSKGLEALKQLVVSYEEKIDCEKSNYYLVIEKELKALEIIKNKLGKHIRLQRFFKSYVLIFNDDTIIYLTQEEFDLLKEVLL